MDGDQKKVRGVEIVETMLRVVKDKLEASLCDEVKRNVQNMKSPNINNNKKHIFIANMDTCVLSHFFSN